jgi:hypothetical protein
LEAADALHAKPHIAWSAALYQTANRIAHLKFLIDHDVAAKLLFVYFVGDSEMHGPTSADEWRGAIHLAQLMLGLPKHHRLSEHIVHVFVPIQSLG